MIFISVEIWPYGDKDKRRTLATAAIANDGSGNKTIGNYNAGFRIEDTKKVKTSSVLGFHRLKKDVWELIRLANIKEK